MPVMTVNDAHAHFFSAGFFRALGRELDATGDPAVSLPARLGWDGPGSDAELADRWVAELDRHDVACSLLMASVPGDEASVGTAAARHPERLAGAFLIDPRMPDAGARVERAFGELGLRAACLFPAMHHVPVDDARAEVVFEAAARHGRAVFVHCGLLSVGVRRKLGLPSRFDLRKGDPLAVAAVAVRYPSVPVVIPHFGAGLFREALMAAAAAPNVVLDTSSSNGWTAFYPGLELRDVFARALDCVGPERLLFGTDSSFFPRGWQRPVFEAQREILDDLGLDPKTQASIFSGTFARVYGRARDRA
jgi:uncharacterized protein